MSSNLRALFVGIAILLSVALYLVSLWFVDIVLGVLVPGFSMNPEEGGGLFELGLRLVILVLDILMIGAIFLWFTKR